MTVVQDSFREEAEERRDQALADLATKTVRLNDVTTELNTMFAEQKRLAEVNSAQQLQILALTERNSKLAERNSDLAGETLRTARGDPDNPPYLMFADFRFDEKPLRATIYLKNSSKNYAAQNVTSSVNLDGIIVTSRGTSVPPNNRAPAAFPNRFGVDSNVLHLPQLESVGSNVTFVTVIASSAGAYAQVSGLVRSSETSILQSVRVSPINDRSKVILSHSDPGFPANFAWPK